MIVPTKRFAYKAVAADGKSVEGEMDAVDESTVIENLQTSGYLPISANELPDNKLERDFNFLSGGRISSTDVHNLTRELATCLNAGLPLAQALSTLTSLSKKPALRELLERIHTNVESGASLSDALKRSNGPFSSFYIGLVHSGEATGALELVLQRLADYQRREKQLRDAILSALLYPAILLLVAGSSLLVLLIYVVPQFQPLFEDLGKTLPWSTQVVVALAAVLRDYWWTSPFIAAFVYVGSRALLADLEIRKKWHSLVLRLPIFGQLLIRIEVTKICRTLGTLTSNGIALLDGVTLVRDTTTNVVIADALSRVAKDLEHGLGLSQPMANTKCFPQLAIQLIGVGEETGTLAQMLLKLADIYDDEAQNSIKRMLTLLEPALILSLGLVIAFIIISILLAILGLNELVV
ncbi:MAG: type II secretion system F family protein [Gammaproteobacteria bacterium]